MNELDKRIAEEVFGEPEPATRSFVVSEMNEAEEPLKAWRWYLPDIPGIGRCQWKPLPFSSDLDQALRALRHFLEEQDSRGALLRTELDPTKDEATWFANLNWRYPHKFAWGQKLPEAICKLLLELVDG